MNIKNKIYLLFTFLNYISCKQEFKKNYTRTLNLCNDIEIMDLCITTTMEVLPTNF